MSPVSLLRNPLRTLMILVWVADEFLRGLSSSALKHWATTSALSACIAVLYNVAHLESRALQNLGIAVETRDEVVDHGKFALYWLTLGILSSVGLGSGLHTFVLFLGPHILRVASSAVRFGNTGFSGKIISYCKLPASWDIAGLSEAFSPNYATDAWVSPVSASATPVTFSSIAAKIAWPAFLWGFGTALGELPPYFLARAATLAGTALEELSEVTALEASLEASIVADEPLTGGRSTGESGTEISGQTDREKSLRRISSVRSAPPSVLSIADRAKLFVYEGIQAYGFWAVLAAASIPNPLFDLAGLTCGHFGIPFSTFFAATFLGKAVIKVSIQSSFLVAAVLYGPPAFEALRMRVTPGTAFRGMLDKAEASMLSSQHALCLSEDSAGACSSCCNTHFSRPGFGVDQCLRLCASSNFEGDSGGRVVVGSHDSVEVGVVEGGSGSRLNSVQGLASQATHVLYRVVGVRKGSGLLGLVRGLWGWILLAMLTFFLVSILDSLAQEYEARKAREDREKTVKAPGSAPAAKKSIPQMR